MIPNRPVEKERSPLELTENAPGWSRLAIEVRRRREQLSLSQPGLARRGGPSQETVRLVENQGRATFRAMTLAQLDRGLSWNPGTARAIVQGQASDDPGDWAASEVAPPAAHDEHASRPRLSEVDDLELAGALVARLTRRTGGNSGPLLRELAAWIDRRVEKDRQESGAAQ